MHTSFQVEDIYFSKGFKGSAFKIYNSQCQKVHISNPISSSKGCADDTKRGLIVNHIDYNPACFP